MKRSGSHSSPEQPTVQDVARLARVSVGTVSHVLTGSRYVRPETVRRVEQAIERLGFRPNRVAQALIRQRTNTIGMIIPDVANPFFAELLRGAEEVLGTADYAVVFGNSDNDPRKQQRYVDAFRDHRVDAVIMAVASESDADEIKALASEVPMVIVDRLVPTWDGDSVVGDNHAGMELMVGHLVELGHRRIALVNGNPWLSTARHRREGFEAALRLRGLAAVSVTSGAFTLESGQQQVAGLLRSADRPTAICAGNDLLALGALAAAKEAGLRVPRDLSVAGYDDIAYASLASPSLTTVWQPARSMGAEAARLVLDRLAGGSGPGRQVVMKPRLVVRESTAPIGDEG